MGLSKQATQKAEQKSNLESVKHELLTLYGDEETVDKWLHTPCEAFEGRSANDLINEGDFESVIQAIGRIKHGIFG